MLIPHKADPNYEAEMKRYEVERYRWGAEPLKHEAPEIVRQKLKLKPKTK